jgi:HD superfamily phosphodiesterase
MTLVLPDGILHSVQNDINKDLINYQMNEQLVGQFAEINKRLYIEAKEPLRCHGVDHHIRVLNNASWLIDKLSADVDESVIIPACLLHDISGYDPERVGQEEHHQISCDTAEIELKKLNYPEGKIKEILEVIIRHGTDHKPKNGQEMIEASILRDADKMDAFGPIGVARIIMAETRRKRTLEEIISKWESRITNKWDSITFPETKEKIKSEFDYARNFFKEAKRKLNNIDSRSGRE